MRKERHAGVLERIRQWAISITALPIGGLGDAIAYMTGNWSVLTRFVDDSRIPMDNNVAERALRNPVLGR